MMYGSRWQGVEAPSSFQHFCASCNVVLVLFHMTDIVCFYFKAVFIFQKTKNKQTKNNGSYIFLVLCLHMLFQTLEKHYKMNALILNQIRAAANFQFFFVSLLSILFIDSDIDILIFWLFDQNNYSFNLFCTDCVLTCLHILFKTLEKH